MMGRGRSCIMFSEEEERIKQILQALDEKKGAKGGTGNAKGGKNVKA